MRKTANRKVCVVVICYISGGWIGYLGKHGQSAQED